ncbi:Zinc finger C2H2-type, partial [Trinorchestia longiramus]
QTYLLLQANNNAASINSRLICPHCPTSVSFTCSSNFRRHLRLHSGERPYKCGHCPYAATRKQHLQSHQARRHYQL